MFVATIVTKCVLTKCAIRIAASCKPALHECTFKVLHLSVQAAPWVYQMNGGKFFPVYSATLHGEATGTVITTQAVVMYKNLEAPVY